METIICIGTEKIKTMRTKIILPILLCILLASCRNKATNEDGIVKDTLTTIATSKENIKDSIIKNCTYKDYSIIFKTHLLKDSVITNELLWQSPTIIKQEISIYNKDRLIKNFKISNKQIHIRTKENVEMDISQIPIIDISFVKGRNVYLYLYGALNCCGTECPEYQSIYNLSGKKCIEFISTEHNNKYKSFNEFVSNNSINLDNSISKTSIQEYLTWQK